MKNNAESIFLTKNAKFWQKYSNVSRSGGDLLIEPSSDVVYIDHLLCVAALIIASAKNLNLVWLDSPSKKGLIQSYCPTSTVQASPKLNIIDCLKIGWAYIFCALRIIRGTPIINCSFNKIKVGDLIYDAYLRRYSISTIRGFDIKLATLLLNALVSVVKNQKLFDTKRFEALLVAQQITFESGILLRVAISKEVKSYLCSGNNRILIKKFDNINEVFEHQYKPTLVELEQLSGMPNVSDEIENIMKFHLKGLIGGDSPYAFSKEKKVYTDRIEFAQEFNLNPAKKNIFVMLHAFTDAPHSQHKGMLFKDYYDWFIKTFNYSLDKNDYNWVFKQHPSIKFYPTKDVDFNSIFSSAPSHVIYLSEDRQINTQTLFYCADLVVSCAGSAGFEFPAFCSIPSLIAGDNFYRGLGFAIEPTTIEEYYAMLIDPKTFKKLDSVKSWAAKIFYLYLKKYCQVSLTAVLPLTLADQNSPLISSQYWSGVLNLYEKQGEKIYREVDSYIKILNKDDFKKLSGLTEIGNFDG